jgi:hypothetical protein
MELYKMLQVRFEGAQEVARLMLDYLEALESRASKGVRLRILIIRMLGGVNWT